MKIAKLSLVAAVAVAGLSTANAQPLEQAIKNVDVSGSAAYRYEDRTSDNIGDNPTKTNEDIRDNYTRNQYKVGLNLKSAVNDTLTFNSRTIIGTDTKMVSIDTDRTDDEATFGLSHANFAYTGLANTTVIAGKQAVPSPFAVATDVAGGEDTGTGLTAVSVLGPVTVAATYLNQTNLMTAGADVAGLGLMGNAGPVALDGWYLDVAETSSADNGHQAYTVGAKAKVEMVNLTGRYSAIAHDELNIDTESLWKVGAAAKFGIVSASLDYGQTNDIDSVAKTGMGITSDKDADADVNLQAWKLNLNKKDDAALVKATVGVDLLTDLNLSATYADLSYGTAVNTAAAKSDANEVYGQLTYKMGKNFMTYGRLGTVTYDTAVEQSQDMGRVHVQYTF